MTKIARRASLALVRVCVCATAAMVAVGVLTFVPQSAAYAQQVAATP